MRNFSLSLLFLVWLNDPVHAQLACDDLHGKVCIEAVQTDTSVTLFAENRYPLLPITLKLSLTLDNLQMDNGSEGPFVMRGGSRIELASFSTRNGGAWSYRYQFNWTRGDINVSHDSGYLYRLPYAAGAAFPVVQSCGGGFTHHGAQLNAIDFMMPEGTPIHAARAGRVVDLKEDSNSGGPTQDYGKAGNYIVIEHNDGTLAQYFHLRQNGAKVALGQHVSRGEFIGYSGNTGQSTGPHLHFDVVKGSTGRDSATLPVIFETSRGTTSCPPPPSAFTAVQD